MTTYEEVIHAEGHENVTAEHASTFEVTSDDFLTPAGDCILGVGADRVPADFAPEFVAACQDADAKIVVTLAVDGPEDGNDEPIEAGIDDRNEEPIDDRIVEQIGGHGHPDLTMDDDRSLVGRTSEYVDDRTIGIEMDKSAGDLDRELVERLAAGADLIVRIAVRQS